MKKQVWEAERKKWFRENDQEYYNCHYCMKLMDKKNTTLDHENNRNHKGRLLPCCYWCNSKKGSVSHDRYVEKYHPNHNC